MEDKDYPYCPGRCKRTLKCYGETWFLAKPGKPRECKGDCKYRRDWENMQHDKLYSGGKNKI